MALSNETAWMDATAQAELIRKKEVTPIELVEAAIERIERVNPQINAVITPMFDEARATASSTLPDAAFTGVPFLLKDLLASYAGVRMASGSAFLADFIAPHDSELVSRYKRAGLIVLGKTNTPEYGILPTTEPKLFGPSRNPWDTTRTTGGSSGGSAAAVASGMVPFAHGNDGGGSIRIPASCCGLFGLKPTRGRVPMGPSQFEGWNGFSAHHAVTISVRDSAALLDAVAGAELGSPFLSPPPPRTFLSETRVAPGKLRIALCVDTPGGTPLDPECRSAAVEAAKLCESLGHIVEPQKLPIENGPMREAFITVINVSIARTLADAAKTLGRAVTEKDVEPVTWSMSQAGKRTDVVAYSRAIAATHQVGLAMAKFQETYDVILSPVLAKPPVQLGVLSLTPDSMQAFTKEITEFGPYTALYNVTGQPSMSVPLHWTRDGLPVGVMFSGRFGDEATLLRLAAQLEKAKPWAGRKPAL